MKRIRSVLRGREGMTLVELIVSAGLLCLVIAVFSASLRPAAEISRRTQELNSAELIADDLLETVRSRVETATEYIKCYENGADITDQTGSSRGSAVEFGTANAVELLTADGCAETAIMVGSRAAGVRPADGLGELFVAARFAIGYFTQRRPDPLLEGRAVQAAGKIERPARPGKILVQLTEYPCGQRVRRFPAGVGRGELQGRDRAVLPVQLHFPKRRMINGCSFHVRFSSCKTGFFSEIGAFSQC